MSIPTRDELQLEVGSQQPPDQTPSEDAALVVMGDVSETTRGSIVGSKFDIGAGFQYF